MTQRLLFTIAAALCSFAIALPAIAEPTKKIAFRLDYEPPEHAGCPTVDELSYTLAGEFGYLVVRADANAVLHVEIRPKDDGFEAFVTAPDASGQREMWQGQTDPQNTCRELSYDISSLVGAHLGPTAWPTDEPPPSLAAPPDLDVNFSTSWPHTVRLPESLSLLLPRQTENDAPSFHAQVGAFGIVMPYGLTGVGVGGSAAFFADWTRLALGAELRALGTPADGIGDPSQSGRSSLIGAAVMPCVVVTPVHLCAVATVNNIDFYLPAGIRLDSHDGITAGLGARVIGQWSLGSRLSLAGSGEVTADYRRTSLRWQNPDGTDTGYDWASPTIRVILGLGFFVSAF